jgi:hypothetical protein
MKDTSDEMDKKFRDMLLARSGEERLKMGCSMHATSKALAIASILEKDPHARPAKVKQALFLRFYGDEFGIKERKRIIRALRKAAEHNGKRRQKGKKRDPK